MEEIEVLPMRKKIMKSFYKPQVLYLCFCSTMQDYKKKINYCVSTCILQICLTNSFNSTHLIFSFLLKSVVYFYHLNHFSQFFAQSPTTLFLLFVEFSYIF